MTSTTWASPIYVQELATILGPQNRTKGSCVLIRPHRMTWQNFGKANRLGYVKILILFMTRIVDIFI